MDSHLAPVGRLPDPALAVAAEPISDDRFETLVRNALAWEPLLRERLVPYSETMDWAVAVGEGVTVVMWRAKDGTSHRIPIHRHDHAQAGCLLEGSFVLHFADEPDRRIEAGDFYAIAGGRSHGATIGAPMLSIEIYLPRHADYEEQYAFAVRARDFGR